jgi:ribonuclease III
MSIGDLALYEQALRHRSLLRGHTRSHMVSNERLEFLGDAVLGAVVAHKLYEEFAEEDEGFLTRVRSRLVNGQTLAGYARRIGLGPLILMSDNMAGADGRDNATILADAFEAVIGAVYLDQGYDASRKFVLRILDEFVDLESASQEQTNFKSMLLEFVQGRGWPQPSYEVIAEEGPSHDRTFTIEVVVAESALGRGRAQSKKKAEQLAAQEALERLKEKDIEMR